MKKQSLAPLLIIVPIIIVAGIIIFYLLSVIFMWGETYTVDEKNSVIHMKKEEDVLVFTGGKIPVDAMVLSDDYKLKSKSFEIRYSGNYEDGDSWENFQALIQYDIGDVKINIPFSDNKKHELEDVFRSGEKKHTEYIRGNKINYSNVKSDDKNYFCAEYTYKDNVFYVYSPKEDLMVKTVENIIG